MWAEQDVVCCPYDGSTKLTSTLSVVAATLLVKVHRCEFPSPLDACWINVSLPLPSIDYKWIGGERSPLSILYMLIWYDCALKPVAPNLLTARKCPMRCDVGRSLSTLSLAGVSCHSADVYELFSDLPKETFAPSERLRWSQKNNMNWLYLVTLSRRLEPLRSELISDLIWWQMLWGTKSSMKTFVAADGAAQNLTSCLKWRHFGYKFESEKPLRVMELERSELTRTHPCWSQH